MNYKAINKTILNSSELSSKVKKNKKFYKYLISNNVAWYYAYVLSSDKTVLDKKVIKSGKMLNNKYIKTLKLIDSVCRKRKIKYLLFKSFKYIPEVIDNDIDLVVLEKDYNNFVIEIKNRGFNFKQDGILKCSLTKKGYCKIEPRVNISINNLNIFEADVVWRNSGIKHIGRLKVRKTSMELDILYQLLSILYQPNYLRLYLFKVYYLADKKKFKSLLSKGEYANDFRFVEDRLLNKNKIGRKFPLFIDNFSFIIWWSKRVLLNTNIKLLSKIKLFLYFFYSKYLYYFTDKLVFYHKWPNINI